LVRLIWGRWGSGCESIPNTGPVIIASNHISNWDAVLLGLACHREVHFLAKQGLFRNRFFAHVLRQVNAIPLSRSGSDTRALRRAIEVLKDGGVIALFPEGTRSKTGKLGRAKSGTGYVAHASGATVIPALISGSDRMWRSFVNRGELEVLFGKPLSVEGPATSETYREVTLRVMDAIAGLGKERAGS
jgi:1-acyl-sn-glycerol-3-phosphate acyltransferase